MYLNKINDLKNVITTAIDERAWAYSDTKGRRIGAQVHLREADRVVLEIESKWELARELLPAGRVFGCTPHALRNGDIYGATQSTRWFYSPEERDVAVAKYFAQSEKAAAKKAA